MLPSHNEVKARLARTILATRLEKEQVFFFDILLVVFQKPWAKCLFLELEDEENLNNKDTVMTTKVLFSASLLEVAIW